MTIAEINLKNAIDEYLKECTCERTKELLEDVYVHRLIPYTPNVEVEDEPDWSDPRVVAAYECWLESEM